MESHCLYYHAPNDPISGDDTIGTPAPESAASCKQQVLSVYSTNSHSSEAQVNNLLEIMGGMCQTFNNLPSFKSSAPATNNEFFCKVTSVISNHAGDQKKKFQLIFELKMKLWMNKLADEAIDKLSEEETVHLFANELQTCYNVAGG